MLRVGKQEEKVKVKIYLLLKNTYNNIFCIILHNMEYFCSIESNYHYFYMNTVTKLPWLDITPADEVNGIKIL